MKKKIISLSFMLLCVLSFVFTPFVYAEDNYHANVYNIEINGVNHGTGSFTYYEIDETTYNYKYVIDCTINLDGRYKGGVTISIRNGAYTKILVENATIYSASDSGIGLWLQGTNYVHVRFFTNTAPGYSYTIVDIFNSSLQLVDTSDASSDVLICDYLSNIDDRTETLNDKLQLLLDMFGGTTEPDTILNMISSIRDDIGQIEYFDNNIYQYLSSTFDPVFTVLASDISNMASDVHTIAQGLDFTGLESAIQDLENAIDNLSGNIVITNNITLQNVPPISMNAFLYFSKYLGFSMRDSDIHYPSIIISGGQLNKDDAYSVRRRIFIPANTTVLLAFIVINNANITSANMPFYSYSNQVNTVTYSDSYYGESRLEKIFISNETNYNHVVSFDLLNNNYIHIIPLYLGDVNAMSDETQQLVQYKLPNTVNDYHTYFDSILEYLSAQQDFNNGDLMDKMDDILTAINQLSINVDYDVVNNTVTNFNTDIDTVHNIEINFKNSFDTYKQRFNTVHQLDDTSWFSPVLFNHIFNNFWSNSSVVWIITLILFCSLIVAMLGIRK